MQKIRIGDKVKVMRGKARGLSGEVVDLVKKEGRVSGVVVKDVNIAKRHVKPQPTFNIPGGIIEVEKPINISNVMLIDPNSKEDEVTRVKIEMKDGKKVRVAKKSGKPID